MSKQTLNVYSMTGFGRAQGQNDQVSIDVEVRSVNSRFLDLNFKVPRAYNAFESEMRNLISGAVMRGRVEVFVQRSLLSAEEGMLSLQTPIFDAHVAVFKEAAKRAGGADSISEHAIVDILSKRDVVLLNESPDQLNDEKALLLSVLKDALSELVAAREVEGVHLHKDVVARFATLDSLLKSMQSQAKKEPKTIKERILARLAELAPEVSLDEERLATEAAYQADRVDVTEELVRLESHLTQASTLFNERPHGKKLDFLLQECGREVNTIGSKTQDTLIKQDVLSAKAELERLREQAMNLE